MFAITYIKGGTCIRYFENPADYYDRVAWHKPTQIGNLLWQSNGRHVRTFEYQELE